MTQTNGLDVLFAWCGFAVLFGVLAYLLLRHHANPNAEAEQWDEATSSSQGVERHRARCVPVHPARPRAARSRTA